MGDLHKAADALNQSQVEAAETIGAGGGREMTFTLDEMIAIELAWQEAQWEAYEAVKREFPKHVELGWVKEPPPRRTEQQIRLEIQARFASDRNFSMSRVVTGARRKWK